MTVLAVDGHQVEEYCVWYHDLPFSLCTFGDISSLTVRQLNSHFISTKEPASSGNVNNNSEQSSNQTSGEAQASSAAAPITPITPSGTANTPSVSLEAERSQTTTTATTGVQQRDVDIDQELDINSLDENALLQDILDLDDFNLDDLSNQLELEASQLDTNALNDLVAVESMLTQLGEDLGEELNNLTLDDQ